MNESVISDFIEVELANPDDFLKVKETLSRIGVSSNKNKTLYQSCHILHKRGQFYIVHFKEMFMLDGKPTDFSDTDKGRRNTICRLLVEWGLVTLVDETSIEQPQIEVRALKILPFHQKKEWTLKTKYSIGNG